MVSTKKNKKIQNSKSVARFCFGFSIFCAAFAFFLIAMMLLYPVPEYEELQEKEIVVNRLITYRRDVLFARTGEVYNVTGKVSDYSTYEDVLVPGAHAQIKCLRRNYFGIQGGRFCVEEIVVDGVEICTYNGEDNTEGWIVIAFFFLLSLGSAFWGRFSAKNVKKQEQRLFERRRMYLERKGKQPR